MNASGRCLAAAPFACSKSLFHSGASYETSFCSRITSATLNLLLLLLLLLLLPRLLPLRRPHPWAPNKPPLNIIANTTAMPLDFLRDLIRFEGAPPL
jgi:hypothetical protein